MNKWFAGIGISVADEEELLDRMRTRKLHGLAVSVSLTRIKAIVRGIAQAACTQ